MKHKLIVLACVGLALLLSAGFAFAQNIITVQPGTGTVNRCADNSVAVTLLNSDIIGGIGLPLIITGPGTITAAAPTGLGGFNTATGGIPGTSVVLNAVGGSLQPGSYEIWTLTVHTADVCSGEIVIDTAFYPPAGEVYLCNAGCELPLAEFHKGVFQLQNNAPTCSNASDVTLHFGPPGIVNKQLTGTDADVCDISTLKYFLMGPPAGATVDSLTGKFNWVPTCANRGENTITFRVKDQCGEYSAGCTFKVTVTHDAPVCSSVGPQTIHWTLTLSIPLPASDDGCPKPLRWTLNSVVPSVAGALSIDSISGQLTYDAACADKGTHVVTYTVSDGEKSCQSTVSITVTNEVPTLVCPTPLAPCHGAPPCSGNMFNLGDTVKGTAVGQDPPSSDPLTYSIVSIKHNGVPAVPHYPPTIDPVSGAFSWKSWSADSAEVGTWRFDLQVSDGCDSAQCWFAVDVNFRYYLSIRDVTGLSDKVYAFSGTVADVYVNITEGCLLGGFDLLLAYDKSGLSFVADANSPAAMDGLVTWEYFTYRLSANSNCTGGCPSGLLRLIAIADLDNGPTHHPDTFQLSGNFIHLRFLVTSDRNFIDQCLPIQFFVIDCGDNILSSKDGNIAYVPFGTDTAACTEHGKLTCRLLPVLYLDDGAICVRPPVDDRGDINQNGNANEISDAVLFSNYFIYGLEATFPDLAYRDAQILATDINDDGIPLTVADLVYLIRIITGDAQPFPPGGNPKMSPSAEQANAIVSVGADRVTVTANSSVDLGGAVFTFRYSGLTVGDAALSSAASQMFVRTKADRGEVRVLVAPQMSVKGARISAGVSEILSLPISGEGTIELVSVEMSDASGALLSTTSAKNNPLPQSYALLQNYPNPFNAGTVISFNLKDATDWTLQVYNITGQTVRSFSGTSDAGQVQVSWDGSDNSGNAIASGVYFYRLVANNFTATKKMTLMK